jgi:16S rRNA (adenine1518-N6/adenine1519-N6)-dimethyltransferase
MGQNFLIDERVLRKIIGAANLTKSDVVLEVGPGIGNLTLELAKKVKKVIAIEKDPKMIEILKENLKKFKNVEIIKSDILHLPLHKPQTTACYLCQDYKVVANIPYYLTSPLIRKFLEAEIKPKEMILMVQKEVAQRICAKPPEMSLLAVSVQFYVHLVKSSQSEFNRVGPKIIAFVSKKSFWPQPKVDSAIIRIAPQINTDKKTDSRRLFQVVRAGFSHPRKQLINNLSKELKIDREKIRNLLLKNNIKPEQRAETLTVENWISLTKSFNSVLK